ncbi:hypothetical protein BC938DRAFT_476011 [Jimgerdemannia flammicorona]|uniref:Uncharacterized protein n=1 Tax=Jimgerdemannia flammicorona TaxID=994334 RepID=A0A433PLI4_9FUNG|nr:hypothetical protein BC938DRAFT_476011 [Jimgerdemannia flammicorona]
MCCGWGGVVVWAQESAAGELVTMKPFSCVPPALAISLHFTLDLAWHTHMLFHQRYCAYTHNVGRRILYHDDTMPDQQLRSGFERTAALWLSTYNMPYVRRLTQSTTDPSGKSNRGANADGKVKPAMIRSLLHWKNKATGEQGPAERKEHGPAAVANENERIMQAQGHKHLPSVPPPGPPSLPPPGPPSLPPPRPSSVAPPRPSSVAPPRPSSVAPPRPSSVAPPGPPPVPPHLPPPAPVDPNANINGNGYYQPADPPRRTVSVNGVDPNSRMYYPAQQYGSMSPGSRPAVVQELSNAQPTQSRSSRYSTFSEPGRYYGTPQYQQQQQYSQSVPTSPASVYSVPGGYYGGAPSNWAALPPGAVPSSPAPTLSSPYQSYPDAYPDTNGTRSPPFRPASPTGPSLLTRGFAPLPGPAWDQYQSPPAPVYALGGSAKEEFYESNKVETGVLFDPQLTAIVGGMRGIDLNGKELADGSERANGSQIGGQAQFGSNGSTKEQAGVQL